jgi:hypothetical protein
VIRILRDALIAFATAAFLAVLAMAGLHSLLQRYV